MDISCIKDCVKIAIMCDKFKELLKNRNEQDQKLSKIWQKYMDPESDHITLLNLYDGYKMSKSKTKYCEKYYLNESKLKTIIVAVDKMFNRLMMSKRLLKNTEMYIENIENDRNEKIKSALLKSHKHFIAKNLIPQWSKKKIKAKISKNSIVAKSHKDFVYDTLLCYNDNYNYIIVTVVNDIDNDIDNDIVVPKNPFVTSLIVPSPPTATIFLYPIFSSFRVILVPSSAFLVNTIRCSFGRNSLISAYVVSQFFPVDPP